MNVVYKFGLMLERIDLERGLAKSWVWAGGRYQWRAVDHFWRVFSARVHGPIALTRRGAFVGWLKAWWWAGHI